LLALLGALVPAALGLAACGGDDGGGNEDAQTVIDQTFSGEKKVDSGKLNMSVTAELNASGAAAQSLEDPVSLKLSGPFQTRGQDKLPEVDLDLSVSGGGQTFTAGALTTGEAAFISYQGTDYRVPEGQFQRYKRQVERDARRNNTNNDFDLGQLGINPRDWIENPKNEGTEEVGGAEAIHVSADVDVRAFVDDLDDLLKRTRDLGVDDRQVPTQLTERQKKQLEESIQDVRFDLFTGKDDKVLRRIEVEFGFDLPNELQEQAQGVESGKVKLALEIADLNEDQDITPPEDARPLSELQSQLGILGSLGGGSGSGSGGGSSGGGSGGGSSGGGSSGGSSGGGSSGGGSDLGTGGGSSGLDSKRSQRYLDCLGEAKKPADIEKCNKILQE
jgi:hypothetical protein